MKRFLAFKYESYYPSGGKNDFDCDYDTLESAVASKVSGGYMDVLDCSSGEWHEFVNKAGAWQHFLSSPT